MDLLSNIGCPSEGNIVFPSAKTQLSPMQTFDFSKICILSPQDNKFLFISSMLLLLQRIFIFIGKFELCIIILLSFLLHVILMFLYTFKLLFMRS